MGFTRQVQHSQSAQTLVASSSQLCFSVLAISPVIPAVYGSRNIPNEESGTHPETNIWVQISILSWQPLAWTGAAFAGLTAGWMAWPRESWWTVPHPVSSGVPQGAVLDPVIWVRGFRLPLANLQFYCAKVGQNGCGTSSWTAAVQQSTGRRNFG